MRHRIPDPAAGEPIFQHWLGTIRRVTARAARDGGDLAQDGSGGDVPGPARPRAAVRVKLADSPPEWAGAVAVRIAVFVDEQGVPLSAELDEHDRTAIHAVAVLDATDPANERLHRDREPAVARAASQAGRYLPVSLAGARAAPTAGETAVLAPVAGTARLLGGGPGGAARFGRLAVLPGWRGHGIGSRLLRLLEEAALARGARELILHAQTTVEPFYTRHGYHAIQPRHEFMEDGIRHVKMAKPLSLEM